MSTREESLHAEDLASIVVSSEVVSEALAHIKPGKSDGSNLLSNHYICALSTLTPYLSKLLCSAMGMYLNVCVVVAHNHANI